MAVYFSEIRFENNEDFVEIVTTDNEDISGYVIAVYDSGGFLRSTFSPGGVDATLAGNDGYVVGRADGLPDLGNNWGVALIDDLGNVVQFISFDFAITAVDGPAAGTTSTGLGNPTSGGQSVESFDGGATYTPTSTPNPGTIPCFAEGTLIETPDGPRPVETLAPGDEVVTVDHGPARIIWRSRSPVALDTGDGEPAPVLIAAGALGPGRPERDLVVSPQHRVLVGGGGQLESIFDREALVPAKALCEIRGIRRMRGRKAIVWCHFALERHGIVSSNGGLTECLLLGPMIVGRLSRLQRAAILGAAGGEGAEAEALNGPPARPLMRVQEARQRVRAALAVAPS